ncbi:putative integral membrane protein [Gordonia polyisoprenivorans VH2]|uniref:Putative integral membrane protein n=1 Tax=Gordonia polyisoprenivorans (strain DSM 44266 / VH2) TaxID=1112204 RepID=H6MZS5_GORPV|nr:YihY/virulence factor BrkB family protein [Gordonia polyisoprenivorans]AFA73176.1 putative integral membrane protein [Gordonia polyisoprenivorans VH2]
MTPDDVTSSGARRGPVPEAAGRPGADPPPGALLPRPPRAPHPDRGEIPTAPLHSARRPAPSSVELDAPDPNHRALADPGQPETAHPGSPPPGADPRTDKELGRDDPTVEPPETPRRPVVRNVPILIWRTIVKSWDDGIVGWAAQAAFWQALSLPPLLLGLLGSVGYLSGWFGPDTVDVISDRILAFANRTFSPNVVNDLIKPTVDNVLGRGRVGVISVGFILSLWAGSSAVSCFVASIVRAHDQHEVRNPVWQRIFALLLYLGFLTVAVPLLPLVALGPNYLREIVPESWDPIVTNAIDFGYFPFVALLLMLVLTTLYHLALPNPLPWHRLVGGAIVAGIVFWVASYFLRLYLAAITRAGYTYGALATPIAFLLFTFFLGFAIVVGAEFNAAVQSLWPARPAVTAQVRDWVHHQTAEVTGQLKTLPERLSTGPISRRNRPSGHSPDNS